MCKDTPKEQSFFRDLQNKLTTSFNGALQDYNALRPHIDRLAQQNAANRGPVIEGSTSMITNRVNGAYALYKSPQAFYSAALNGYQWAYYFTRNNDLNSDVRHAGMAALYSHMWPLSLRGAAIVAVTGLNVSRGGAQELEEHVRTRYEQQRNALVVSGGLSMGLTQVFKKAGTVVQTDMQRLMVRSAMRTWQVTGVVGLCYGLSRLHNTMEESGVFGTYLKEKRDAFARVTPSPALKEFEDAAKDPVVKRKV
jgi:hypothetical protein